MSLDLFQGSISAQPNRMKDLIFIRVNAMELGHLSLALIVVLVSLRYGVLIHHIHEALLGFRGRDPLRHHNALGGRWLLAASQHLLICALLAT